MEKYIIEKHPFTPFIPEGAVILICGTFPPKRDKWAMDFFYPNYYNDMWRVFGLIFFNDKEHFFNPSSKTIDKAGIMKMLTDKKIGIGETATEVIRTKDNASDKYLQIVTPINLQSQLEKIPLCKAIVTTGEKAATIIASLTNTSVPQMGCFSECEIQKKSGEIFKFRHFRMPSTSRAFPMKLENKAQYYSKMLHEVGII